MGSGALTVDTGFPGAEDFRTDVTIFKTRVGFLELIQAAGTNTTLAVDRATVQGTRITGMPPSTPGGPPDGRTAVRRIDFVFDPGYITTPPTCTGSWTFRGAFTFNDGLVDKAELAQPCEVPAAAVVVQRPKLQLTASPIRAVAGRRTRLRVRVSSTSKACVQGARLLLGARRVRLSGDGRAVVVHRFPGPGAFHFIATARGCVRATRTVNVSRRR